MGGRLVEMVIESVRVHMLSTQHVVILKDLERRRYLPIWIGPWEANAIAMRLQGLSPERPLTHDLFAGVLEQLGATIREVVIADLADETFHARIMLEVAGRVLEIDSRPSDALALAVRADVRIFAAEEVLDRAGVESDQADDDEPDRRGAPLGLPRFRELSRHRARHRPPPGGAAVLVAPGPAIRPRAQAPRSGRRDAARAPGSTTCGAASPRSPSSRAR